MNFPECDVCGCDYSLGREITMTSDHRGLTILCSFCEGRIKDGMIRPESDGNGGTAYRQWFMGEWTPGPLIERRSA